MSIDPGNLSAVAVVLVAGLVRGFSGFGSAMVIMPGLSLLYGPVQALAILVLVELPVCLQLLPTALREAEWNRVLLLAVPALVGLPLGVAVLVRADPEAMRRAIAVLVLAFVGLMAAGWRPRRVPGAVPALGFGLTSGVVGGATGISGPPIVLFFLASPVAASRIRGSIIAFFTLTEAAYLAVFGWRGLLGAEVLGRSIVLAPFFAGAIWAGSRLFRGASEAAYRRVAFGILAVVAVAALSR